jgi:hypothetical protein
VPSSAWCRPTIGLRRSDTGGAAKHCLPGGGESLCHLGPAPMMAVVVWTGLQIVTVGELSGAAGAEIAQLLLGELEVGRAPSR